MAIPIKDTPVLKGKDSQKFNDCIEKSGENLVPKDEQERIRQMVKKVLNSAKI
jgi:hypothetical protein